MLKPKAILCVIVFVFAGYNLQSQTMSWVLLPDSTSDCTNTTNIDEGLLCYGLKYTPNASGVLTSYTTGFFIPRGSNGKLISYNESCTMEDNSAVLDAGPAYDVMLFNSSGNSGTPAKNTVEAGVPVILHQVCFSISPGESAVITEDNVTDLTTNIDLPSGRSLTEFPEYTEFKIRGK